MNHTECFGGKKNKAKPLYNEIKEPELYLNVNIQFFLILSVLWQENEEISPEESK